MKAICFSAIVVVFFSCNNRAGVVYKDFDSSGGHWIAKRSYDAKGRLLVEELLDADSVRAGYFKKWNGNKVVVTGNYFKGKKEGRWVYTAGNGDTVKVESWFGGRRFGEQLDFFSPTDAGGKPLLHKYSFFNLGGEDVFTARFKTNGEIENVNGFPMFTLYNKSDLKRDSLFEVLVSLEYQEL